MSEQDNTRPGETPADRRPEPTPPPLVPPAESKPVEVSAADLRDLGRNVDGDPDHEASAEPTAVEPGAHTGEQDLDAPSFTDGTVGDAPDHRAVAGGSSATESANAADTADQAHFPPIEAQPADSEAASAATADSGTRPGSEGRSESNDGSAENVHAGSLGDNSTHAEPASADHADEPSSAQPASAQPAFVEPVTAQPVTAQPEYAEPANAEPESAEPANVEPAFAEPTYAEPTAVVPIYAAPPVERPVFADDQPAQPAQQRVFLSAPEVPTKRGNRGLGSLIAIVSVIIFAAIYAGVAALIIHVQVPNNPVDGFFLDFIASRLFWVPAIMYVVAFVIVVLVVNRANWWAYVLGSLVVAAVVYFGTIAVGLFSENLFAMTSQEASARFAVYALNPFVIAAAFVAREVSIWTGSAIAARGRRLKVRNTQAREEYERLAEAHRAEYERGYTS